MSDQELDDLFKEAAARYHPPDDSQAWEGMASLLDKPDSGSGTSWMIKTLSIVALLVLFSDANYKESSPAALGLEKTELAYTSERWNNKTTSDGKEQDDQLAVLDNRTSEISNVNREGAEQMKESNIQNDQLSQPRSDKRPSVVNKINSYQDAEENSQQRNDTVTIIPLRQQPESYKKAYWPEQENGGLHENKIAILQDSLAEEKKIIDEEKKEEHSDSTKQDDKEEKKATRPGRMGVKLAVSPDLTSVGYYSPGKLGLNYGVLLEYSLNEHWIISTGVLRSRKIYSNSEQQDNGYGAKITRGLDGNCYMLDIPVNVQYHFTPARKYSLYVSAGLSSYIMNREDYTYSLTGTANDYSYDKSVRNENSEWFKIVNISIGLQRQFSKRMYFQVEPFIKVPVADLGEARIRMVSTGAFVQVKYVLK